MHFLGLEVGSWADWFGAVETISAVLATLSITRRSGKVRIKVKTATEYVTPEITLQSYVVQAINVGQIPTDIVSAGFLLKDGRHMGFSKEKYPCRIDQEEIKEFREAGIAIFQTVNVKEFPESIKMRPYIRTSTGM